MSRKDVPEKKATKPNVFLSSHGLSTKSNFSNSGPNIGRRIEQQEHEHWENQPPAPSPAAAAAPPAFHNTAHTLPPNGKPPSLVSRLSVSSLPPQRLSSSSSSAPISVLPSPSVEDDPQSTFLVKAFTKDASHSSSVVLRIPHRSPPCREGLQRPRNDGAHVNLGTQQTMSFDNHLQSWTIVNELPPRIAEKGASLVHKKKTNGEAFQHGFADKAFIAYADQVSFTNKQQMQKENLDMYDSDSSSDLFELDTLGGEGMRLCRRDLPVFGTKG